MVCIRSRRSRRVGRPAQVRTFTELIGACCKTGALDASFGLLYQMMAEGVEPSRVTFDIMLRASCVADAPQRFLAKLAELVERCV